MFEKNDNKMVYVIIWKFNDPENDEVNVMVFDEDHFEKAVEYYDCIKDGLLAMEFELEMIKFVKRPVK